MTIPSRATKAYYNKIPAKIALLLKQSGVQFGYLYEKELYSGALIYDLGVDDVFAPHAIKVYNISKKHEVKNVITLDPHTTNMLRTVYPLIVKNYDLNVKSYIEVLADKNIEPRRKVEEKVVIHDSCVYTRNEDILTQQRNLLKKAGITILEPKDTGQFTCCCGSPVESIFPRKAYAIARKRIEQMKTVGENGLTMCPICLLNLSKASNGEMNFDDIANYLEKAYLA